MSLKNIFIIDTVVKIHYLIGKKHFSPYPRDGVEMIELNVKLRTLKEVITDYLDHLQNDPDRAYKTEAKYIIELFSECCNRTIEEKYKSLENKNYIYNFIAEANIFINDIFNLGILSSDYNIEEFKLKLVDHIVKSDDPFVLKTINELQNILFFGIDKNMQYTEEDYHEMYLTVTNYSEMLEWYISVNTNNADLKANKDLVYSLLFDAFTDNIREKHKCIVNATKNKHIDEYIQKIDSRFNRDCIYKYTAVCAEALIRFTDEVNLDIILEGIKDKFMETIDNLKIEHLKMRTENGETND